MNTTTSVKVRHVSTSTVLPATQKKDQRIELNPSDLRSLRRLYSQVGNVFAKPPESSKCKKFDHGETNMNLLSHMKSCLSQTLDYFFPLAGRLAMEKHENDGTISFYINCNSVGAEFIHAVADVTIDDLLKPTYTPEITSSFFPLNGIPNYEGLSLPLLSIQVTELIGGIFVGVSMNHVVCDGACVLYFSKLWSLISKGLINHISHPPPVNLEPRWFPNNTNFPIHLPFSSIDKLFVKRYVPDPLLRERSFHFTPDKIAKLKAMVNSDHNRTSPVSALQAVLAHIWIAITRARNLRPNESVSHTLVISFRDRLDPPVSIGYFGNLIQIAGASVKAGDLLVKGDKFGALLLNQAIETCDSNHIERYWQSWVKNPVLPSIYDLISPTYLGVVGSTRFDQYGNDFGWGAPLASLPGSNFMYEGRIMTEHGQFKGVITVSICLPLKILQVLENDVEFMEIACSVLPPQYSTRATSLSKL
ncbi:hypothetical protein MKW92_035872 [Papaver armeniacum]|nr:hypothetical protein MKW92_035872 [Papaver armeniacum]